jgi:hypothetical protein
MISRFKTLAAVLATALLCLVLTPAPSSAATAARPALGSMIAGEWVGTWRVGDVEMGVCHQFSLSSPDSGPRQEVTSRIQGMSAKQSKRAKFLDNRYHGTDDAETAKAWQLAIWTIQDEPEFRAWYRSALAAGAIPQRLDTRMRDMLEESRRHGPYTVTMQTTNRLPGTSGRVRVEVLTQTGKPAPAGLEVTAAASGPVTLHSSSTALNRRGVAKLPYSVNDVGAYSLSSTVSAPSHEKVLMSTPSPGRQIIGGSRLTTRALASVAAEATTAALSVSHEVTCEENCTGKDLPVQFTVCNDNGRLVMVTTTIAGQTRQAYIKRSACWTEKVPMNDGDVTPAPVACYVAKVNGPCISRTWTVGSPHEVVCPGWAEVQLCVDGRCGGTDGQLKFTTPESPRHYTGWYRIGDGPLQMVLLGEGSTTVSLGRQLTSGARIAIGFSAYRDSARTDKMAEHKLLDVTFN